jgi:hypothetical protein
MLRAAPESKDAKPIVARASRLAPNDPWIRKLAAGEATEAPDARRLFESRPPREW